MNAPRLPSERPAWAVPYWINNVDPVAVVRVTNRTLQQVYHAYTWLDLAAREDSGVIFRDTSWDHSDLAMVLGAPSDLGSEYD